MVKCVTTETISPPNTIARILEIEKTHRILRMDRGETNAQWIVHFYPKEPQAPQSEPRSETKAVQPTLL